jgi:hypothetical protein
MATEHADVMARLNGTLLCVIDRVSETKDGVVLRGALVNKYLNCDAEMARVHLMNTMNDHVTDYASISAFFGGPMSGMDGDSFDGEDEGSW